MTKEQEAIENLENLSEYGLCYTINEKIQEDIETVLNMLKEKEAEIEKYKKLLADNLAKNLNDSIKAKEKADTDLDDLDKGWKVELEKKDKMIDLILDKFKEGTEYYYSEFDYMTKEDLKQYFERKVEDD